MKRTKYTNKHIDKTIHREKVYSSVFQQYIKLFPILFVLTLIILIGFISLNNYFSTNFLFFFKDIGSDSINQDYPALVGSTQLLKESIFNHWAFFKGMGNSATTSLASNPLAWLIRTNGYIGTQIWGVNFIIGRFLRIFFYHFLF